MRKHLFLSLLTLWSFQAFGQSLFVDSCFSSVSPGTSFANSADMVSYDADLVEWNGAAWTGGWPTALISIPPVNNVCRAVWIGSATVWTTGGEGFAMRLVNPLVTGQSYSIDFTYVSHGFGNAANFSPIISSNLGTILGTATLIGTLPPAAVTWTNNTLTFTATAAQNGHDFIMIHNGATGSSGLVQAFCSSMVDLGQDTTLCGGTSLLLDATTGGATYTWQDGSANPTFNATTSGLYWVEIDVNGCLSRDSINIASLTIPTVNLGNDTTICIGDTLLLDASFPGSSYEWQDFSFDSTFAAFNAGQYWAVVSNTCGFARDTINISQAPIPTVNLGNDTSICVGTSLAFDITFPGAAYNWSDGPTVPVRNISVADTFWAEVTNLCATALDSIIVGLDSVVEVDFGPDLTLCVGDTTVLNATVPGGNYEWQDASSLDSFVVTGPGTYFVVASQKCGFSRDTIEIFYETSPVVSLGNDTTICLGTALNFDVSFPTSSSTYLWSDGIMSPTRAIDTSGVFWVEISNNCGTVRDTIIVSLDSLEQVNLGPDQTLCEGDSTTLDATILNANYEWQDGTSTPTYLVTNPGVYHVVTSQYCGFSRDTIQVNYLSPPSVNLGADTSLCAGQTLNLSSGHPNLTVLWQDSSFLPDFLATGPGLYWVNVSNTVCTGIDSIVITSNTTPFTDLGLDTTLCDGNLYILDGTATEGRNVSYQWQDGNTTQGYPVVDAGVYSVTLTNECGSFTDFIAISTANTPDIELGPDTLICGNGTEFLLMDVTWEDATYYWNNNSTEPTRIAQESGIYWVNIENECGIDREKREITFELIPKAEIGLDTAICEEDFPITLSVENVTGDYTWQDGTMATSYEIIGPGSYSVETENLCGIAQDAVVIEERVCRCYVHIPTGFTPNGDDVNDFHRIGYQCNLLSYSFDIFNRWGQKVFTANSPDEAWDGYFGGRGAIEGVYTWVVRYSYEDRGDVVPVTEWGTVTLIR